MLATYILHQSLCTGNGRHLVKRIHDASDRKADICHHEENSLEDGTALWDVEVLNFLLVMPDVPVALSEYHTGEI